MRVQIRIYKKSDVWKFSQNFVSLSASVIWKNLQISRIVLKLSCDYSFIILTEKVTNVRELKFTLDCKLETLTVNWYTLRQSYINKLSQHRGSGVYKLWLQDYRVWIKALIVTKTKANGDVNASAIANWTVIYFLIKVLSLHNELNSTSMASYSKIGYI